MMSTENPIGPITFKNLFFDHHNHIILATGVFVVLINAQRYELYANAYGIPAWYIVLKVRGSVSMSLLECNISRCHRPASQGFRATVCARACAYRCIVLLAMHSPCCMRPHNTGARRGHLLWSREQLSIIHDCSRKVKIDAHGVQKCHGCLCAHASSKPWGLSGIGICCDSRGRYPVHIHVLFAKNLYPTQIPYPYPTEDFISISVERPSNDVRT